MKRIFALILALIMCLPLCACGDDSVFGTYKGKYLYDGNQYAETIILNQDGTYTLESYKNGELISLRSGEFYFEDGVINLVKDEHISTPYKVEGRALVNNGYYFYKK